MDSRVARQPLGGGERRDAEPLGGPSLQRYHPNGGSSSRLAPSTITVAAIRARVTAL
jgi:hypothetical protein